MGQDERLAHVWTMNVITLFPDSFPGVLGQSLTGRALTEGKWALSITDLRLLGMENTRTLMTPQVAVRVVLRADVVGKAIDHVLRLKKRKKT